MKTTIAGLVLAWLGFLLILVGPKNYDVLAAAFLGDGGEAIPRAALMGLGLVLFMFAFAVMCRPSGRPQGRRIFAAVGGLGLIAAGLSFILLAFRCQAVFRTMATTATVDTDVVEKSMSFFQQGQWISIATLGLVLVLATMQVIRKRRLCLPTLPGVAHLVLCVFAILVFLLCARAQNGVAGSLSGPGAGSAAYMARSASQLLTFSMLGGFLLVLCGAVQQAFWFGCSSPRPITSDPAETS